MKTAKLIAALGVLSMTAVLVYGFTAGDFSTDGGELLRNPWGVVSLVDLYVGFSLFSLWIIYREGSPVRSLIWVALMLTLGFFTGALYTLLALWKSEGSWERFWQGSRYSNPQ
jgi:hypothetical protein